LALRLFARIAWLFRTVFITRNSHLRGGRAI
jgi:hypothetical protein